MPDSQPARAPLQPNATRPRRPRGLVWPLLLVVAVGGMTTMAAEMAASRLLGPYFGDSIVVWANLIGLILIYLTLGATLGGRWADRSPYPETLYTITAIAALWIGLIPLVSTPILRMAQSAFLRIGAELAVYDGLQIGGSFVSVLLLLAPPIVLLGTVSPFAIRLATRRVHTAGRSAGRIYALSTVGSIVGTFAPVLITIPALGTTRTFYLFGALLLGASIVGLVARRALSRALLAALALIVLLILALLLTQGVVKADERMIFEAESRYNYIQVLEVDGVRYLMLNEGQAIHSMYDPNSLATLGTWDVLTIAPFLNAPPFTSGQVRRVAIIGLAGGTIARQATRDLWPHPHRRRRDRPRNRRGRAHLFCDGPAQPFRARHRWTVLPPAHQTALRSRRHRRLPAALHPLPIDNDRVLCPGPGASHAPGRAGRQRGAHRKRLPDGRGYRRHDGRTLCQPFTPSTFPTPLTRC